MNRLLLSFSFLFIIQPLEAKEVLLKSNFQIQAFIRSHTKKDLMHDLREVVNVGSPNRFIGTKGHFKVQKWLEKKIETYGSSTGLDIQNFKLNKEYSKEYFKTNLGSVVKDKKWKSFHQYMQNQIELLSQKKLKNYVWFKKGETKDLLIFIAHYDTVSHDKDTMKIDVNAKMPGADYNASGVSIGLALVKKLNQIKFINSIAVVFTDAQSIAFSGAKSLLNYKSFEGFTIKGVVNLEMLGHDSKTQDRTKKIGNMACYGRKNNSEDKQLFQFFQESSEAITTGVKFKYKHNSISNSDHSIFWDLGHRAISFSQNWEDDFNTRRYQTPNDFPETLNQKTLYNAYKYITAGALSFAQNKGEID